MDGDFKGDFTRDTFDPLQRFSRVLMQQGRVQLDADWNEQADLLLWAHRRLIMDLVGSHWGVFDFVIDSKNNFTNINPNSFKIQLQSNDFTIADGRYYVDGILSENQYEQEHPGQPLTYLNQVPQLAKLGNTRYWVYLDVWERQITYLEDSDIREVALGENGPDTATRAEIMWQIKTSTVPPIPTDVFTRFGPGTNNTLQKIQFIEDSTNLLVEAFQPAHRGALKARGKTPDGTDTNLCITPPDSQFRGDENQLYRLEVHTGGKQDTATFKWSRENGSVVLPIAALSGDGNTVTLENLGRDSHLSVEPGDWVEIVDDDYLLQVATSQGPINPLRQVTTVDRMNLLVTLKSISGSVPFPGVGTNPTKYPLLRRWDQKSGTGKQGDAPKLAKDGTIRIQEGTTDNDWLILEDGVQVQFQPSGDTDHSMTYRTGDYWLIPARTVTGDVLWPQENDPSGMPYPSGHPKALPPRGVQHHYALLAVISFNKNDPDTPIDLRDMVPPLEKLAAILDAGLFSQSGL
jgi:Family of unknown function (DUF6519)